MTCSWTRNIILMGLSAWTGLSGQIYADSTLEGTPVREIRFVGNQRTHSHVLIREMQTQSGDTLDLDLLEGDLKRLQDLALFNRIVMIGSETSEGTLLTVMVTEQWYFIPFPILRLVDRSWDKIAWGAGAVHNNFRGEAERISGVAQFGYDPHFSLAFTDPWLWPRRNWSAAVDLQYSEVRSKAADETVTEIHRQLRMGLGYRFTLFSSAALWVGWHSVSLPPFRIQENDVQEAGTDRMGECLVSAVWDRRDLKEYAHQGWMLGGTLQTFWPMPTGSSLLRLITDFRGYLPLGEWTAASRIAAVLSRGRVPIYNRVYFGYSERIRGHFSKIQGGDQRIVFSAALRRPLLPVQYFTIGDLEGLADLRFGVGAGLFADSGVLWDRGGSPRGSNWLSGWGAGIHLILPYRTILRLECAWNEEGAREWIADLYTDI